MALALATAPAAAQSVSSSGDVTPPVPPGTSDWDVGFSGVFVGQNGDGQVSVLDGGTVSSGIIYLGSGVGAEGVVVVSGTGSIWTSSNWLSVGERGIGMLTVADGGTVSNAAGFIGYHADAEGSVTVSGTDSSWENSSFLFVGYYGVGTLTVADGGTVSNTYGYIGYDSDAAGSSATVSGAGSTWTNSNALAVGFYGTGTLTIADGGTASAAAGFIGYYASAAGSSVTVSGAGSIWENESPEGLSVGLEGTGSLTVEDGGRVSNANGYIGRFAGAAGSSVTVSGTGSIWENSASLFVGHEGAGSLTVEDAGVVTSVNSWIGSNGGDGAVLVTGADSLWHVGGNLNIDAGSIGALRIEDGGMVRVNGYAHINNASSAVVTGIDSFWRVGGSLVVAATSAGSLTIADGGQVRVEGIASIGSSTSTPLAEVNGTVLVTGPGAGLTVDDRLFVGDAGTGTLRIENGAAVSSGDSWIGHSISPGYPTSDGTAVVTGTGSAWAVNGNLTVAEFGDGRLLVTDGATVRTTGELRLAVEPGANGTLAIGAAAAGAPGTVDAEMIRIGSGTGIIVFNHTATSYDFASGIAGNGNIEHLAGATTLSGNSDGFSGVTELRGGRLDVAGRLGGVVEVGSGATLSGSGAMGGVRVADGGIIAPGTSIGTMTIWGDLVLNQTSQLHYELGAPGIAGAPGLSDRIVVGSNLTLDGRLHLFDDGGAGIGHYRLMTYGGNLTDNTLDVVTPGPVANAAYTVHAGGGNVDLVITSAGPTPEIGDPNLQYWRDASPTWTTAGTDWRNDGGEVDVAWAGNHGVFNGPGGTIAVEGTQSFRGLQFVTDGYVFGGAGALHTVAEGSELRVLAGETATIGTRITGAGGITKTQGGTLILTGDNTHGGTIVGAGTLVVDGGSLDHPGGSIFVAHFDSPGTAALRIENGGTASSFDGWVGSGEGAQGTATVNGPGSSWTVNSGITVGDFGAAGTLIIAGGGAAASNVGTIGTQASQGTATVTGPGSTWTMGDSIAVGLGLDSDGTLRIEDGGAMTSPTGFVGFAADSRGAVTVTGPGSIWTLADELFVGGFDGNGTLDILAGGFVTAGSVEIGSAGGTGLVHLGSRGTLQAPLVQVLENGTLSGIGLVVGDVLFASGGTLTPGESIGTLEIIGNATFNAGSTYVVEVEAPDQADLFSVTGTATINGGAVEIVTLSPEVSYADGQSYRIIQAGTVVRNGDFTLNQPFLFLAAELDYGASFVDLLLSAGGPGGDFTTVAQTFNQRQAATALNDLEQSGDALAVYNALLFLGDANEARRAFDLSAGEVHASGQHVIDQSFDLFSRTLRGQASAGIGAGMAGGQVMTAPLAYSPSTPMGPGVAAIGGATTSADANSRVAQAWLAPLGGRGVVEADGNAGKLDWWTLGLAGGYEGPIDVASGNAWAGFGLGYLRSRGSVDARLSSFDADGFHIGAYGGWTDGPWSLAGSLAYAANRVSTERRIVFSGIDRTAEADYWSHTIGFSGEAAYGFALGGGTTISPLATLDAGWSGHGGFSERGAGALNLTGASESWTRLDTGLGFAIQHVVLTETGKVTLDGRLLWEHAFADVVPSQHLAFAGSPTGFTVRGPDADRDRVRLGLGVSFEATEDLTVRAGYTGLFSGNQQSHAASVGINVRF